LIISHVFSPGAQSGLAGQHHTSCFFFFKTTALLISLGFNGSLGNAGSGGGNVESLTAVDAHFGALFRVMNTDGFASNACTKCGTSFNNDD
jgi:hypothetical protein